MGLFHKTIKDIKKLVAAKKYTDAKRILDQHIVAEHQAQNDLTQLMRYIGAYQQKLWELQQWWGLSNLPSKFEKENLTKFETMIDQVEGNLKAMKHLIAKLQKEEKIKLE